MRRLLGRQTNDATADNNLGPNGIAPLYRPSASQDAEYTASGAVACFDTSPDKSSAILGGRHVLKTIHIDGSTIKEGVDLRAIITAQPSTKTAGTSTTVADQLSIKDVKWATDQGGESTIFTACANGRIFQYNLARLGSRTPGGAGLEFVQMREDSRQINTLDISPHKSSWLLSGSQDGIVRCFDTHAPASNRNGQETYRSFLNFKCNAEGIRDVQWSPGAGFIFACATESGAVFKWDIRKHSAPVLRINAHDPTRGVSCIAWHFDSKHLLSAGLDSSIHVWDMSSTANKRQKPKWSIATPAPVACATWRPPLWSVTAKGKRAAQVAVSYVDGPTKGYGISPVHIWDFGRPTMPFKEIDRFDTSPNSLMWHDQDLLWAAGMDGFTQCDAAYTPKSVDRKSPSSLCFGPRGDVLMLLEERAQPRRHHPSIVGPDILPPSSFGSSPSGQILSHSRSDSEEDVVGSFLGPSKAGKRKSKSSSRSANVFSSTPPSGSGNEESIMALDKSIGVTKDFRPDQVMAIGQVNTPLRSGHYQYLSWHYLDGLSQGLSYVEGGDALDVRVCNIMELYARAAERIGQMRLSQNWRILAQAFGLLLKRRAQYHLEQRTTNRRYGQSPLLKNRSESKLNLQKYGKPTVLVVGGGDTSRKTSSVHTVDWQNLGRSLLNSEPDSESNVPTPIAGPIREDIPDQHQYIPGKLLTPVRELDSFTLPPAFQQAAERPPLRQRLDSTPLSVMSQDSQVSSTEGYDFYDIEAVEAIPRAIDVPKKKEPLTLGYANASPSSSQRPQPSRHDSDESFAQMFSVSDGSRLPVESSSFSSSLRRVISRSDDVIGSRKSSIGEYQSRIRGKQIQGSPGNSQPGVSVNLHREDSGSSRDIFMISQTTADSGESQPSQEEWHGLSQPSIEDSPSQAKLKQPQSPRRTSNERVAGRPEENTANTIVETDFIPWEDDPPYPFPLSAEARSALLATPSLEPYELLSKVLAYEARNSALNASAMILLLKPLVPYDVIDPDMAAAILRHHHDRLMKQKFFVEAATLRNLCVADWPTGVDVWGDNFTSIFFPAQDQQRVSANFSCPKCHKPREINRSDGGLGLWKCEKCGYAVGPCAVCKHRDATMVSHPPMPLARGIAHWRESRDEAILSTWWYCPGCKHGGHAECLEGWHSPALPSDFTNADSDQTSSSMECSDPEALSEGCCPMDGCGHACLPGRWQEALDNARTESLERKVREQTRHTISYHRNTQRIDPTDESTASAPAAIGGVRSDALEVSQSRAVEGVREALAASNIGSGTSNEDSSRLTRAAGGILSVLSSSPGRSTSQAPTMTGGQGVKLSERERRKSVKFAGATDERR